MSENETRVEEDSMGELRVPHNAMYGASTARAVENFPISDLRFKRSFIRALAPTKPATIAVALLPSPLAGGTASFTLASSAKGSTSAVCQTL